MSAATAVPGAGENWYVSSADEKKESQDPAGQSKVSQDEFLQLLVKQLTNQDPLNPMENVEFIDQMAQLQSLEEQIETNRLLGELSNGSQVANASAMIGTQVTGSTEEGVEGSGIVQGVNVTDGKAYLWLGTGHRIPLENVTAVAPVLVQ